MHLCAVLTEDNNGGRISGDGCFQMTLKMTLILTLCIRDHLYDTAEDSIDTFLGSNSETMHKTQAPMSFTLLFIYAAFTYHIVILHDWCSPTCHIEFLYGK